MVYRIKLQGSFMCRAEGGAGGLGGMAAGFRSNKHKEWATWKGNKKKEEKKKIHKL